MIPFDVIVVWFMWSVCVPLYAMYKPVFACSVVVPSGFASYAIRRLQTSLALKRDSSYYVQNVCFYLDIILSFDVLYTLLNYLSHVFNSAFKW